METLLVSDRCEGFSILFKFGWHFGNYIFPFPLSPAKLISNVLTNNVLLHCKHTKKQHNLVGIGTVLRLLVELEMLH